MSHDHDVYMHGHADSVLRSHRWRTAENSAGHLMPYLDHGSAVLDVGCGPGTVTLDFARHASEGRVVGVDRSPQVLEEARGHARQAGIDNVEFAVGDAYQLGFPSGSFDVVHAHQLLHHLTDPLAAIRELARVCTPTGVVGLREVDYSALAWWPAVPELDEWLELFRAVAHGNGVEPAAGRRLKSWAQAAGLDVRASSAGVWCYSSPSDVAWWGEAWAERVVASDLAQQAKERGLASAADLDRLAQGWLRWSASPDAWFVLVHGELVASPAPASDAADPA